MNTGMGEERKEMKTIGRRMRCRALAAVLALVLPVAAALPAYAEEETGSSAVPSVSVQDKEGGGLAPQLPGTGGVPAEQQEKISFRDVQNSFARDAITRLADLGLISGEGQDLFNPQRAITRQEMAVLISKAAGLLPREAKEAFFADVPADSPFAPYVNELAQLQVLRGRDGQTLGAADPLTRQEMAVVLERIMRLIGAAPEEGTSVPYEDESEIADYARAAVAVVSKQKWMQGAGGRFNPQGLVTRAEAAVIAARLLDTRYEQATRGGFAVDASEIRVSPGGTKQLKVTRPAGEELPFTPIFAFDRPELGEMLPDGTFVAGPEPGKGNVTITVGYRSLTIPVVITEPALSEAPSRKAEQAEQAEAADSDSVAGKSEPVAADETDEAVQPESDEENAGEPANERYNIAPKSFSRVNTIGPEDPLFRQVEKQYPGPVGGLTAVSEEWTGYNRQYGRQVTVVLPEAKNLERVNLTFLQRKSMGITLPKWLEVEVSRDGKAWSYAGKALHDVPAMEEETVIRTLAISLPEVEARYVRVSFPVEVFVFARQLEVWVKDAVQGISSFVLLPPPNPTKEIANESSRRPVENMLLAYSGMYDDLGTWRAEDFLPMVGYLTQDGYMRDQMFDTVLFLPYQTMPATKESWEAYLDDLFRKGRQLDALNSAMREYNRLRGTLYTQPTKENVVIAIPYPAASQTNFGRLFEDKVSLSFSPATAGEEQAYQNRKKAVEWYFQELMKRWEKAEFNYLRLEGIYWFHELVEDSAPKERELIRSTAAMVHKKGLRFYWIPYFGAPGVEEWKSLHFDYAFLQPNYYSDKSVSLERFDGLMDAVQKYGLQIEIEGDHKMYRDPRFHQLYYNQLAATHRLGLDKNTLHAYYYGSKTLLQAVKSTDPELRAIYDDTYKWIRGRFGEVGYTEQEVLP